MIYTCMNASMFPHCLASTMACTGGHQLPYAIRQVAAAYSIATQYGYNTAPALHYWLIWHVGHYTAHAWWTIQHELPQESDHQHTIPPPQPLTMYSNLPQLTGTHAWDRPNPVHRCKILSWATTEKIDERIRFLLMAAANCYSIVQSCSTKPFACTCKIPEERSSITSHRMSSSLP